MGLGLRRGNGRTPDQGTDRDTSHGTGQSNAQTVDAVSGGSTDQEWDEAKAGRFMDKAQEAGTLISQSYMNLGSQINYLSVAYKNGYDQHKGALEAASARKKLVADLLIGAALTFAAGAAGPFIASAMKGLTKSQPIIDGVTDLGKWAIGQAGTAASPPAGQALTAFPMDPFTWSQLSEGRVRAEGANAYGILRFWEGQVNAKDPDFNLDLDPVAAFTNLLKVGGSAMSSLPAIDMEAEAKTFERGFWAKWCELYAYHVTVGMGGVYYADENVPKEAMARIVELEGSESAAQRFVEERGAKSREKAEKEAGELTQMRSRYPIGPKW